jgi:dolichol-phosphate mannosyltransferase
LKIIVIILLDILSFFILRSLGIDIVPCLWISFLSGGLQFKDKKVFSFLAFFLATLFLRGGFFAWMINWPIFLSIPLIAIISQAILSYRPKKIIPYLIGYSIFLRLLYLGLPNSTPEEAYYWNYSKHLSAAFLDHPPMVAWLILAGTKIFGHNEFAVRFFNLVCWSLMALYSFFYCKNISQEKSLVPVLLLATFPLFFAFGFFTTPDAALFAVWAGSIYFFERIFFSKKTVSWIGIAIFLGLGMLTKYTIALLGFSALTFILLDKQSRKWLYHPMPYLALIIILLIFSPVIYWNYEHEWASFAFQTTRRISAPIRFSFHNLLLFILIQITPLGIIAYFRRSSYQDLDSRKKLFLFVFTLVPLSVFGVFSIFHEVRVSWTTPIFLVAMPLFVREFNLRKIYQPFLIIFLLFYGFAFHYMAIGIPGMPFLSKTPNPVAWREMVKSVSEIKTLTKPLYVGMDKYMIASELAFYLKNVENVTSSNLFGRDGLMYGFWFDPKDQKGKPMILVGVKPDMLSGEELGKYFEKLDPVIKVDLIKQGKPAGAFYYRIGYSYSPK